MPDITLWPHQEAAIQATLLGIRAGLTAGLIVLPTGTGKTGFALSLGRRLQLPALFAVHRDELLRQTVQAAGVFWPEAVVASIESGTKVWDEPDLRTGRRPDLVVAMVPSLHPERLATIAPDRFGLVELDEAHHAPAPAFARVLDHFRPGFLLGITATPQRLDGRGLAARFGRQPLYSYALYQAIKDGRLVPPLPRAVQTETDLDRVGSENGDLVEKQLARTLDTPNRNLLVAGAYQEHAQGRRAIAFCVDVDHCEHLAAQSRALGIRTEAVTGRLSIGRRRDTLPRFAASELDLVTSCETLTEGFDDPAVSCLLLARPTESKSLLMQMVGRGLRLSPATGKKDCLVLDFVDVTKKHKLVSVLDLLGRHKGPAEAGHGGGSSRDKPTQTVLPLPPGAVRWRLETVCPWPELPSLEGYAPAQAWQAEPASEGQLRYLARFGLQVGAGLTKGEASYLIDRCLEYESAFPTPATPRQQSYLQQHGLWQDGMSRRQASTLIAYLKAPEKPHAVNR